MENSDRELILKVLKSNMQLQRLYEEHLALEDRLSQYKRKSFLTSREELEEKELKKTKLMGVDMMMSIVYSQKTL